MASCGLPPIVGPTQWDTFVQMLNLTPAQEKAMLRASMRDGINRKIIVNKG